MDKLFTITFRFGAEQNPTSLIVELIPSGSHDNMIVCSFIVHRLMNDNHSLNIALTVLFTTVISLGSGDKNTLSKVTVSEHTDCNATDTGCV
eukprot:949862-Amphidinium_carterae.1